MRRLVSSIDPGKRYAAVAGAYSTEERNAIADVARLEGGDPERTGKVCARWTLELADGWPITVYAERPQAYVHRSATHKAVKELQATLTAYRAELERNARIEWRSATPNTWKGQVPKDVHHARIMPAVLRHGAARIPDAATWERLSHDERDALALLLWGLGAVGKGGAALGPHRTTPEPADASAPPLGPLFAGLG